MDDNIICRLCLEVVPVGYTILKDNIQSIIRTLTSIDVSENDSLPKLSCSKCIFNLYFVENVKSLITKSDEKLHSLLDRDGNFNELLKDVWNPTLCLADDDNYSHVEVKEEQINSNALEISNTIVEHNTNEVKNDLSIQENSATNYDCLGDSIKNIIRRKNNTKPYLYHCNVCNVDFQGNKLYMKHKGKHMKKTCKICGVTTRQDNFSKHMTNHKLGQQICDICGSIHKSLEGLRTHLFHFHNAKKKPYACTDCGETFKYSHRLTYHKRKIHTGFRPHQCETCGKRFFDLGTMKKHVKLIHLKLREHRCKYCQKDYSSRHALKVHIRQHTDETPYMCEICTEGFRQLVSLKTHMAKHDNVDKPSTSQEEHKDEEEEVVND